MGSYDAENAKEETARWLDNQPQLERGHQVVAVAQVDQDQLGKRQEVLRSQFLLSAGDGDDPLGGLHKEEDWRRDDSDNEWKVSPDKTLFVHTKVKVRLEIRQFKVEQRIGVSVVALIDAKFIIY